MNIVGKIGYHAGTAAAVQLDPGEKLIGLWCVATGAGGTVVIAGGDTITLVAGVPFAFALESRAEEWVGVLITFTATASYFLKTKKKVGG